MKSTRSTASKKVKNSSTAPIATDMISCAPIKWEPHKYQLHAVKFLLTHGAAALFLDPGLGKTSIVLAALRYMMKAGTSRRALIIAPLRVCHLVWPSEVKKWADFCHLRVEVLHGKDKDKALARDADIYVINPEGLDWLSREGRFKMLGADTLVIDESSKFKHTNTQRFKMLKPWLPKFSRRWILTGTPTSNGLMDLFGQIFILDLGRALGQYITRFRNEFFDQVGFDYILQPDGAERIYEAIKPLALRLNAEDLLELPKIVVNDIRVELPPDARKVYADMEHQMFMLLDDGEALTAGAASAVSMKCRQIANGGVYRDAFVRQTAKTKSEQWAHIHDAKTDALVELIESIPGQPILIAYEFQHDLDRIRKVLGKDVPVLSGQTVKRTLELEVAWNRGELPYLLGHPASIGHGLNLQRAGNHVAWYSLTWDLELYDQFIRRVRRQGNKHSHVFVHRLIAARTVDEAVALALQGKDLSQRAFLGALATYRATRKK